MKVFALAASALLSASLLLAQDQPGSTENRQQSSPSLSLFPAGYADHSALSAALKRVAEAHADRVRLTELARSGGGREVWLAAVGKPPESARELRPSILIVANLEGDHLVGSQVAVGLVEKLAAAAGRDDELGKWLESHLVYVVPRLNPDGAERTLTSGTATRVNLRRIDRDRDGKASEDGPDDLNGDGLTTLMRVRDARATLVPDSKDARILRKADAAKGERAVFSEYAEGLDNDGDGVLNEDSAGGVNLNRNWPERWTEFDPETGTSPASEPEVRALIQFCVDHPEIVAIWSFGLNDNLRAEPKKPGSTLDDADLPLLGELSRAWNRAAGGSRKNEPAQGDSAAKKEAEPAKTAPAQAKDATKGAVGARGGGGGRGGGRGGFGAGGLAAPAAQVSPTPTSELESTTDGSLSEWAYHMNGALGLASRLWATPEIPDPPSGQPRPPAEGEPRWLYWNDRVMGGRAFVPYTAFDHPTLGKVEIGGWKPGVRINPPAEQVSALTDAQFAFLKDLAARLPRLEVLESKVEAKGHGVFQISATVANTGYLPTALGAGVRTRRAEPVLVRLKPGGAKILAGPPLSRIESLAGSGGRREFRWLVLAPEGVDSVEIEAATAKAGVVKQKVDLRAAQTAAPQ